MSNSGFEKLEFYQLSMQLWDLCWLDTQTLIKDSRGREISNQLIRAVGSISANIEEGYGRMSTKEYAHFLTYSLGSAQEARGWYLKSKFLLDPAVITQRQEVLEKIIGKVAQTIQTLKNK